MVAMALKRHELAQHTHSLTQVDHTHSLAHLHQHSWSHFVQSASSVSTEFGIKFFFGRYLTYEGGVANRNTRRKPLTACPLIGIKGENPTFWVGIEPSPSSIGDKLTH